MCSAPGPSQAGRTRPVVFRVSYAPNSGYIAVPRYVKSWAKSCPWRGKMRDPIRRRRRMPIASDDAATLRQSRCCTMIEATSPRRLQ